MTRLRIRQALARDYTELLALNTAAVPAVNTLAPDKLARLHQQSCYCGVAEDEHGIAGFLLAMDPHAVYESINFGYFCRNFDDFVYVDRIVVDLGRQRRGVGLALYGDLLERTPAGVPRLACEVNLDPPNPGSLAFHQRLGFVSVGEQDVEDGHKKVRLMVKPID